MFSIVCGFRAVLQISYDGKIPVAWGVEFRDDQEPFGASSLPLVTTAHVVYDRSSIVVRGPCWRQERGGKYTEICNSKPLQQVHHFSHNTASEPQQLTLDHNKDASCLRARVSNFTPINPYLFNHWGNTPDRVRVIFTVRCGERRVRSFASPSFLVYAKHCPIRLRHLYGLGPKMDDKLRNAGQIHYVAQLARVKDSDVPELSVKTGIHRNRLNKFIGQARREMSRKQKEPIACQQFHETQALLDAEKQFQDEVKMLKELVEKHNLFNADVAELIKQKLG